NTRRILDLLAVPPNLEPRTLNLEPHSPNSFRRTPNSITLTPPSQLVTRHSSPATSTKATFFCLGWIAERYPHLIKEIQSQGHEIACHGYAHQLIYRQSREEFREDIHKAKGILEDIIGREVIGYRAPSYSITNKSLWAFEVMAEEGFKYDSSIFPIRHDFYGIPDAPRFPFLVLLNDKGKPEFKPLESTFNVERRTLNNILEFPLSTFPIGKFTLPLSGGGYFRLLPYTLVKSGLKRLNEVERKPFIFYLHPWEIDPAQPRIGGAGLKSRFRHYINLSKTETRFKNLLSEFHFLPVKEVLKINEASMD
ncbi:MAG: XrtA system polysaccharide deacetylase, partial [Pseudomonadota bacterium]